VSRTRASHMLFRGARHGSRRYVSSRVVWCALVSSCVNRDRAVARREREWRRRLHPCVRGTLSADREGRVAQARRTSLGVGFHAALSTPDRGLTRPSARSILHLGTCGGAGSQTHCSGRIDGSHPLPKAPLAAPARSGRSATLTRGTVPRSGKGRATLRSRRRGGDRDRSSR